MGKLRYIDKSYLCRYDLSNKFFEELGINVIETIPLRKVYILNTDNGKKILKKLDYDEERLNFIDESLKYINRKYENTMHLVTFNNGKPIFKWNNDNYIVMDLIEGHEASNSSEIDARICAEALANMHNASKGLEEHLKKNNIKIRKEKDLIYKYKQASENLIKIKKWVENIDYKNEFDELFLTICDRCIEEAKSACNMLWISDYKELLNNKEYNVLCHNDLAHHNFLINGDEVNIIDFDYATLNLRAVDIADFLLKWIKNSVFDVKKANIALKSYDFINHLDVEEYKLIYIIMSFPRDLYSIITSYYFKEKEWEYEVFLHRFKMKIENEPFRYDFLTFYRELIDTKLKNNK